MNPTGNHILIKPTTIFDRIIQNILVVASKTAAAVRMAYEIPFRVLPESVFSWRIVQEYHLKPADLEGIDVLVLYRCFQGSTLSLVRLAQLKKIKVIYELDDDLLDPPTDQSWGARYRNSHLSQIIKMFLSQVDLVKAGSPELAKRLKEMDYPAFYQSYAAKTCNFPVKIKEPPYRVGYFGSPHHQADIEMLFPALLALKELFQEQIEFEFIGCYPQNWQQLQAHIFPYEPDYEIFLEFLAGRRWSLGLAPLRQTLFNEAKSNSKFRDFTTAGILGIYADLAPYRDTVMDGQNGWLTKESPEEWAQTIKKALSCTERSKLLQQAKELLQTIYSPETVARNWICLIKELTK